MAGWRRCSAFAFSLELGPGEGYCVGVVGITKPNGSTAWRVNARGRDEHEYSAKQAEYYRAAVRLAELVRAELKD